MLTLTAEFRRKFSSLGYVWQAYPELDYEKYYDNWLILSLNLRSKSRLLTNWYVDGSV